jgi:hypothetical protein
MDRDLTQVSPETVPIKRQTHRHRAGKVQRTEKCIPTEGHLEEVALTLRVTRTCGEQSCVEWNVT